MAFPRCIPCRFVVLALFAGTLAAQPASNLGTISDDEINKVVDAIGTSDTEKRVMRRRLTSWKELSSSPKYKGAGEPEKLKTVNDFVHETPFYCDPVMWCKEDYWAKPVEFLANDGGDCEDFSIAKYFTLRELGVSEDRLRIVYAVYQKPGFTGAHMVLAYYASPDAEPLILDNINQTVLPASSRPDLVPVFSFNTSGLWNAKESKGRGTDSYRAWSDQWKQVQTDLVVHSVSPDQRKGAACQALIQASPWCR